MIEGRKSKMGEVPVGLVLGCAIAYTAQTSLHAIRYCASLSCVCIFSCLASVRWYHRLMGNEALLTALGNSLLLAVVSSLIP